MPLNFFFLLFNSSHISYINRKQVNSYNKVMLVQKSYACSSDLDLDFQEKQAQKKYQEEAKYI